MESTHPTRLWSEWRAMARSQRMAVWAAYLGWTLDAFDFFLLVMAVKAISAAFGAEVESVSRALFYTLAARPVGALVFGWAAERLGRRPVMIAVVLGFSLLSALSGLAQTLGQLLVARALFGFAMGGEWGIGASLAMESIPPRLRGPVSGLIQSGYPSGFFLASLAFFLLFDRIGWRGMFFLGLAPALLVLFVRLHVEESPLFAAAQDGPRPGVLTALAGQWRLALYLVVLMALFNAFSHGTQDLYPTFLQKQRHFDTAITGSIAMVMNGGAIAGAMLLGPLSERIGRRRTILLGAGIALLAIPLWVGAGNPWLLGIGAFLMQAGVQGCWAMVPAHLNELSPPALRAVFPGVVYQLGNLLSSYNAVLQSRFAAGHNGDFALALGITGAGVALLLAGWVQLGPERRGQPLAAR